MNTQIDKDGPLAWVLARYEPLTIAEFTILDENGILSLSDFRAYIRNDQHIPTESSE